MLQQMLQQISSQFTKLFFNDPLIWSPFMDQKPFSKGMVGKRSFHLAFKRRITPQTLSSNDELLEHCVSSHHD